MKAAVLHGREDIRVEELAPHPLAEGEVRVTIGAALTCGTDLKVFKRGYHARMIVPPAVFGHEFAGTISEVGPRVEKWKEGDRVVVANSAPCGSCAYCVGGQENLCDDLLFLNGAYAESIVVPRRLVEKNMLPLAAKTRFRDAALTEPLACVVHGWQELKLDAGSNVLVIGSGPIGLMFAAVAAHEKCRVTVAGRGKRLKTAKKLAVSQIIEATGQKDFREAGTFDAVIEAVGKPEAWEIAARSVRKGGRVNFFGGCPAGTTVSLDTNLLHYSNLTLFSSFHHTPRAIRRALDLIESGSVPASLFVDGEGTLDQLPDLFRSMASENRAVKTFIQTSPTKQL
ncbi:MAG TPA: alcohol dehydrogenase catalytic domain-containing protein [Verrucomicrobiae bacterium]